MAVATASILFDGLSQTQFWFDIVGVPALPAATVQLLLFLGVITGAVLLVARLVGTQAMASGLLPIALGYLIAHYLTAIAFDGQRILVASRIRSSWAGTCSGRHRSSRTRPGCRTASSGRSSSSPWSAGTWSGQSWAIGPRS